MSTALARRLARGAPRAPLRMMPSLAVRLGIDSGVHRLLESPLVINGAEGSTILRWIGSQAAASGWPEYGGAGTLALQAGTAPSYGQPTPYLGSLDGAVKFNAGGWFDGGQLCDFTTEDVVLEWLYITGTTTAKTPYNKWATNVGLQIHYSASLQLAAYLNANAPVTSAALSSNSLVHALLILDRSGSGQWYINAAASGAEVLISGAAGSATTTTTLTIGASVAGDSAINGQFLYVAHHRRASGWLDTHLQPTLAAQRFALLTASRPAFSIVPSTCPSSAGSTSPVYQQKRLDDGTDRLFYMGPGTPTFARLVDAAERIVVAHLIERGNTNSALQSDAMGTTWTQVALTSISANGQNASDGQATLDGLVGTAVATPHGVTQAITFTATEWCISAELKAGDKNWAYIVDETIANGGAYLNLATGAWGTVGAGVKDKWVLYTASGTVRAAGIKVDGTAAAHTIGIYAASGDGGQSFAGDAATVNLWIGKVQVEAADYPSSRINTTTAAVTRAASIAKWSTANCFPRAEGTLLGKVLARSFTPTVNRVLWSLNDGSATNEIYIWTDTSGRLNATSTGGGSVQLTGSIFDNNVRAIMLSWSTNRLDFWCRSAAGVWARAQDMSITPPAGSTLTICCVGSDWNGANQAGPGAYPLAGWQLLPSYFSDPSAARSAFDLLQEAA